MGDCRFKGQAAYLKQTRELDMKVFFGWSYKIGESSGGVGRDCRVKRQPAAWGEIADLSGSLRREERLCI